MRLLNQSCEAFVQKYSNDPLEYMNLMYKHIERCGRTCYRSSDKITEDSAKPFVDRMINSKHFAMLEHGTIYLKWQQTSYLDGMYGDDRYYDSNPLAKYKDNKYSIINKVESSFGYNHVDNSTYYVTTNYRVLIENNWLDDLKYLCEPTEHHKKRYTLFCTTALHCYKDLTRHRVFSFAIESTRYCNYNKEKFGKELTFIKPLWTPCEYDYDWADCGSGLDQAYPCSETADAYFTTYLANCEKTYLHLIDLGWQAQQAAEVLPQCIKGDMIITGFEDDWKHLLDLRYYGTTGAPHPMVKELATLMKEELEKLGFKY